MKKYIAQLFVIGAVLLFASSVFAANATITSTTTIGGSPFTPSTKVGLKATATATAYTATSCHLSGTKEYATVGGSTGSTDASTIFSKDIPTQSSTTACAPTDPGTTAGAMPTGTWN